MATIHSRTESKRGCGFRKKGGKYFVSDGIGRPCGRLPIPLVSCPCCNQGIKQSRGFTWISGKLLEGHDCSFATKSNCRACPLGNIQKIDRLGLMWVGGKFYPSTSSFTEEANRLGVSKRIAQIPRDFVLGETWIALAHPEAVMIAGEKGELEIKPGIFHLFKPTRIEYIVKGTESEEELDAMEARGFTLINILNNGGEDFDQGSGSEDFDDE